MMSYLLINHCAALVTDYTWIFFLVLSIILFTPIISSRLRIPHVIGLIMAGIVVGEYGFDILERDSSFELFGQVGIYYIMFLASLELDMGSVKKHGRKGLLFGLLTFCIPFVLGYYACIHLLGMEQLPSLLLTCLFSSHTLVAYPIVGRYGIGRHETVVVSVVATAFATLAALLALAVVVGMQNAETDALTWVIFATKCVVYIAFVILVFPKLGRWFLRRYDDSVMQYIFILSTVFLSAALARLAGLEGLLGAFLAGLVINRLIPRTSPLMTRLEFVGQALFIPYFLIGVGMMINLRVLAAGMDMLKYILIMVFIATATKLVAAWVMNWIQKGKTAQFWLMFGLTNAHAAGALAIVMIGYNAEVNLMDERAFNGTIMVILFSCLISSLATNAGARKLALTDTTLQDNRGSYHGKCLVAYSQESNVDVMTQLAILIRNPHIPDSLMGLNVVFDDEQSEELYKKGKLLLENAQKTAASADIKMATLCRMSTNVASGIIRTIKEYEAGEVILCLTDRETGMAKAALGNVINQVLSGSFRELIAVRLIVPPGTLKNMVIIVPEKAEYEVGFFKWLEHLGRMGEQIGCKMVFYVHGDTMRYIQEYMEEQHENIIISFRPLPEWRELRKMISKMNKDQLLVIVTARAGFISHVHEMEHLPQIISKSSQPTSVMLLYPDQWGEPQSEHTFFSLKNRAPKVVEPRTFKNWLKKWKHKASHYFKNIK